MRSFFLVFFLLTTVFAVEDTGSRSLSWSIGYETMSFRQHGGSIGLRSKKAGIQSFFLLGIDRDTLEVQRVEGVLDQAIECKEVVWGLLGHYWLCGRICGTAGVSVFTRTELSYVDGVSGGQSIEGISLSPVIGLQFLPFGRFFYLGLRYHVTDNLIYTSIGFDWR